MKTMILAVLAAVLAVGAFGQEAKPQPQPQPRRYVLPPNTPGLAKAWNDWDKNVYELVEYCREAGKKPQGRIGVPERLVPPKEPRPETDSNGNIYYYRYIDGTDRGFLKPSTPLPSWVTGK